MNQNSHEHQTIRVTVHSRARVAVAEALHTVGMEPVWQIQGNHASIELCLTGLQAAKVIDTVLPAVTLRTRGCPDVIVVASLGPHTGSQPCCMQETVISDRGETPYAEQ